MMRIVAIGLALIVAAPSHARPDVDPARLAIARQIVEQVMPPGQRDAMIDAVVQPTVVDMQAAFDQSSERKGLFAGRPGAREVIERFAASQMAASIASTEESLPTLLDAIARAYARRFTKEQLVDINGFFQAPNARAYVAQSMTMMSDPVVQAAQRTMITKSLEGTQERIAAFVADLQRAEGDSK